MHALRAAWQGNPRSTYALTRFVFLRGLGGIYFVAFLSLVRQLLPLFGEHGLLPARTFLAEAASSGESFWTLPSIFWLGCSDRVLTGAGIFGLVLSGFVALGLTNAAAMAVLWFLYMSFVHVGQIFYGFGWEILLLETGFLAIFLCPVRDVRPFPKHAPPAALIWLLRWVLFRLMFGAGLIKIRGDACWRDLTCLVYHYETQPLPNPLSWLLHQMPVWFHKLGVLYNHFVELVVPWFYFGPRRVAIAAGLFTAAFQLMLILSGNLSWLNWLTLVICVSCFDDRFLQRLLQARLAQRPIEPPTPAYRWTAWGLTALVAALSIPPVLNLLSRHQVMNTSFGRLHLVNTYGAFGSVGKVRDEVILQGTRDATVDANTRWEDYEFPCKPGDVNRAPCVVAPFQWRLDWEIWFAAMESPEEHPWLVHLIAKLLRNDPGALSLMAKNPFPDAPPKFIRAELYEYHFTHFGERPWWTRRRIGPYLPPLSKDDPRLREFLQANGWQEP